MLKKILFYVYFFMLFVFLFIPMWAVHEFEDVDLNKIVFHFHMPLNDIAKLNWSENLYLPILGIIISFLFLLSIQFILRNHSKIRQIFFYGSGIGILVYNFFYINNNFMLLDFLKNQYTASSFIEENYVNPKTTNIVFPEKKRNLIFIQVESLESSVQDKKNGGLLSKNYIPELTKLAKENVSFSHNNQISGATVLPETGWTIAAMVAETAGLPLILYRKDNHTGSTMNRYSTFLPGAVTLGDILKKEGYKNVMILGMKKEWGGAELYLTSHGSYKIIDKTYILKKKPKAKKYSGFGAPLADDELYEQAKKQLKKLSKRKQPFHLWIQTMDAHFGGYLSPDCKKHKGNKHLQDVYLCVSSQLSDFISWIQKMPFYENTTIVIVGDHCNMSKKLFKKKGNFKHDGNIERKIYNVFINPAHRPIKEKQRRFSTMDIFPSLLGAIGVKITGNRLALGTDLFSDTPTLPEKYDYPFIFEELKKKSNFYNKELLYP